jgi:hypothetical protein
MIGLVQIADYMVGLGRNFSRRSGCILARVVLTVSPQCVTSSIIRPWSTGTAPKNEQSPRPHMLRVEGFADLEVKAKAREEFASWASWL